MKDLLKGFLAPIIALLAALGVTALAMTLLSNSPTEALLYLFIGPAQSRLALGNVLEYASLITLAGIAASMAFRSGSFNLGGEGQAFAGGLTAAAFAIAFPNLPRPVALPLALSTGCLAGGLLGSVPGVLRARWNVDELISSFLLSAAVLPIGNVLLGGIMKDPDSYLIAARPLPAAFQTAHWWPPSGFGPTALWALTGSAIAVLFLGYTRRGYEWRLRGANESFARYGGIRTGFIAVGSMSLSGAVFGFAGAAALAESGQAVQGFTSGLGWDGLAVALIAASRPSVVPLAALAYAWLTHGTQAAMMHTGFSYSLSSLVQASVFLLVTAKLFSKRKSRW